MSGPIKFTKEQFIEKLKSKNLYYANGEFEVIGDYSGAGGRIEVQDKYGKMSVFSSDIMRGRKLTIGHALNKDQYLVNRFKETHGDKYDYSLVKWDSYITHVKIICPHHGEFEQIAHNHIKGFGCKLCNINLNPHNLSEWKQMRPENPGIFYILRCIGNDEYFYKVGITCNSIKQRYQSKSEMPYSYEVIKEIVDFDRDRIWNLEKKYLKELKNYHYSPKISFSGSVRECFSKIVDSGN